MPVSATATADADRSSNATYLAPLTAFLRSDDVIRSVADDMRLWNMPEFSNPPPKLLASIFPINRVSAEGSNVAGKKAETITAVKDALAISRVRQDQAVKITFRSRDPETAADIANAFARTFIRYFANRRDEDESEAVRSLEQRLKQLSAKETAAKTAVDSLKASNNSADIEKRRQLKAELQTYQALHETVLQQYAEAVKPRPTVLNPPQIITEATPDPSSNATRGMLALLLAACGAGIAGTAVAARREFLDRPIRDAEAIEQGLGLRYLGTIAAVPGRRLVPQARQLPPLILHDDRDVLRKALASIREVLPPKGSYVIGVSSTKAGEGKSTLAFNLAVVAAEGRERVLLIDADLHQPRLIHELGMPPSASLHDILRRQTRLPEPAGKSEYGFDFVGAHEPELAAHPASVLGSPAMTAFLANARDTYDVVFCDLPDISSHADPIVLASSLDAVLLIAEWGTPATRLARVARQSHAISARVLGVLINKAPLGAADFA
jgi:Mrp family chromosome partitioning ATPase